MYVNEHVKNTQRVFPMQGRGDYLRFDMNENPDGLPQDFVQAVLQEITPQFLAIYPEPDKFQRAFANFVGVNFNQILATNGTDMAVRYLFEVFGEPGKSVVTVSPTFEMYRINCCLLGLNHVPVAYNEDLTIDIEKILKAITDDVSIVVLLNPNNPVGNVYSMEEVDRVIKCAAQVGALVVIDEAYHYFYEKTFLDLINRYSNVAILRTFSKLFSIPACRLGVVISSPQIISYLKNIKLTFDVNSIALLFGEKLLENTELVRSLISAEKAGKEFLLKELQTRNYFCRDCKGNYIFIEPRHNAQEIARRLREEKKVLVHPYSNPLLARFIRVSTGSLPMMKLFLSNFLEVDQA